MAINRNTRRMRYRCHECKGAHSLYRSKTDSLLLQRLAAGMKQHVASVLLTAMDRRVIKKSDYEVVNSKKVEHLIWSVR